MSRIKEPSRGYNRSLDFVSGLAAGRSPELNEKLAMIPPFWECGAPFRLAATIRVTRLTLPSGQGWLRRMC